MNVNQNFAPHPSTLRRSLTQSSNSLRSRILTSRQKKLSSSQNIVSKKPVSEICPSFPPNRDIIDDFEVSDIDFNHFSFDTNSVE